MAPPQSQPNQSPAPRVWNPPTRSTAFIGRQAELAKLAELLCQYPRLAIVATGGMGKTAVAAEALFELARSTDPEVPVPHTIYSHDYYRQPAHANALAGLLAQAGVDQRGLPDLTGAVKSLFSQPRVLLYLEGCEKAEQLTHLLELVGEARVLLTSRDKQKCGDAHPFELSGLQPEDAAQLLHHHAHQAPLTTNRFERPVWLCLGAELGHHPLALCLAGRWMHNHRQTPVEFANSLQIQHLDSWSEEDGEKANLHRLFAHSADAVAAMHPRALEAWYALALHAHAPIHLPALRGALGGEEKELRSALAALVNYSLAEPRKFPGEQAGQTEPAWQLTHALLGEWGRGDLRRRRREESLISSPKAAETQKDSDGDSLRRHLRDEGDAIFSAWLDWWEADLRNCFKQRSVPGGPARYQALQPHWDALLLNLATTKGSDSTRLSLFLNQTANAHRGMGNYSAAEPLYRRDLETSERVLGPEHPDTLTSVNNLASLLHAKGDLAAAEPLCRRALTVRERVLGPEHPNTLTSVNNLAGLLRAKGDLAAAEPLFRRALTVSERVLGPEHPGTLISVNNLAGLLRDNGDLATAEPLYRRALTVRERVLGPEHPSTLISINNLALLLKSKGDLAAAEPLYRNALTARERVLGPEHPETLGSVNNLATLLYAKGDLAAAVPLLRRALEAFERMLGPEHSNTLGSVNNLASLLESKGDLAGALPLFERAAQGLLQKLGPDHRHTKDCQWSLARVRAELAKKGKS